LVLGLSLLGSSLGIAQEFLDANQKETLRGLETVNLIVNVGFAREGPSKQLLWSDVAGRLREIPLQVGSGNAETSERLPAFVVDVVVLKRMMRTFSFLITVRIYQHVGLLRDEGRKIPAITWKKWIMGEGGFSSIREKTAELVDHFTDEYRSVNPVE